MRKDGVNLQRNTRGQFAAKCGGQIARNIQSDEDSVRILDDNVILLSAIESWGALVDEMNESFSNKRDSIREICLDLYKEFNAQSDLGQIETEIWKLVLTYGYGSELEPTYDDSAAIADYSYLCSKDYGSAVNYVRSLYFALTDVLVTDEDVCSSGERIAKTQEEPHFNLSFGVYPNPTTGLVAVKLNQAIEVDYDLSITNSAGMEVYRCHKSSPEVRIDTKPWNSGIYFITLKHEATEIHKKLVVLR